MNKLQIKFIRILMVTLGHDPNVTDADAEVWYRYNRFDIKEQVSKKDIDQMLINLGDAPVFEPKDSLCVGDKVTVDYKGNTVVGEIKTIGYQVKGAGNKYFSEEDFE